MARGNTKLEITWTVAPFLIVAVVGYFSFRVLQTDFVRPANAATYMDVHVIAHLYGSLYEYSNGVRVDSEGLDAAQNPMAIPVPSTPASGAPSAPSSAARATPRCRSG